ncbi:uncharacterized protein BT62DRAFT_1077232 [Guyanagaster necrorhizus]|uniref:Uncharacterized protein n=1 Tax=Guyanagaster necrorhizus TaxID=856835 RepID=A0A9P7VPI2_9AGAR|nr:uncharacterized protein BT62DRAFT_1077232 [Guyanagaster necrorhizus MCA 3950]KAG7445018.1 hypothetical protein BT62DRAFT_1077232 [Guyanagaster necrorhizus MCA 3950]
MPDDYVCESLLGAAKVDGFPLHAQQQTRYLRDFTSCFSFSSIIEKSPPLFHAFRVLIRSAPLTPLASHHFFTSPITQSSSLDVKMTAKPSLRIRIPPAINANNLPNYTARTTAEQAREQRLKDDPLACIVGPYHVTCKLCGSRIKLSEKSTFDGHHWRTHRGRCVKARKQPNLGLGGKKLPSRKKSPTPSPTTSLTSDEDSERIKHLILPLHSSSVRLEPQFEPLATCDAAVEEYLLRSHGITKDYKLDYQSWSWSQLKLPSFVVAAASALCDED